jgi:hypothetical protein
MLSTSSDFPVHTGARREARVSIDKSVEVATAGNEYQDLVNRLKANPGMRS